MSAENESSIETFRVGSQAYGLAIDSLGNLLELELRHEDTHKKTRRIVELIQLTRSAHPSLSGLDFSGYDFSLLQEAVSISVDKAIKEFMSNRKKRGGF